MGETRHDCFTLDSSHFCKGTFCSTAEGKRTVLIVCSIDRGVCMQCFAAARKVGRD